VAVWRALLGAGGRFGTSFGEMLTYLVLTQLAVSFVWSFSGNSIARLIRTGDIAIFMSRPLKLKEYLFMDDLGKNIFEVLVVSLPACAVLGLVWDLKPPESPLVALLSAVMLLNGLVMLFQYRYILGLVSFWLVRNPFTEWHFQNAELIFSGQVLPIWLCPAWLTAVSGFLPFRYFTYEPLALFIGKTTVGGAPGVFAVQIFWMAALFAIERAVSGRAFRKLTVQGG
jgi:ABC-2 type transport system permease protein